MKLALAAVLLSSTASPAPCMRPELLPAEVPLMACPVRTTAARCTARCPSNGRYLDLHYRGAPRALAVAWRNTLNTAGWRTRTTELSLDPDRPGAARRPAIGIHASRGPARLSTVVMAAANEETLLSLTFTPG